MSLALFMNKLGFLENANMAINDMFTKEKYAAGQSIDIRLPYNFTVGTGAAITPQNLIDRTVRLTVEKQYNAAIEFSAFEYTLNIRDDKVVFDRYIAPMLINLAEAAENLAISKLLASNIIVGTPGVRINTTDTLNIAKSTLRQLGVPTDDLCLVIDPLTGAAIENSLPGKFVPTIGEEIIQRNYQGKFFGMKYYQSPLLQTHVAGVGDGTNTTSFAGFLAAGQINANVSSGDTQLVIKGLTNGTVPFLQGDIIQMGVTQSVNPVSRVATGLPMTFVAVADATVVSGGLSTVQISPAVISDNTSPYQNVSAPILANEFLFLAKTHRVGYVFAPDFLYVAMPPLAALNRATVESHTSKSKTGISLRVSMGADIRSGTDIDRADILMGALCNPQFGVRLVGA